MDMLGIGVPVEFDEISNNFAVEELNFFSFGDDFHEDVCARWSINMPILLVIQIDQLSIFLDFGLIIDFVEGAWEKIKRILDLVDLLIFKGLILVAGIC